MGFLDFIFGKKNNTQPSTSPNDPLTNVEVLPGLNIPKAFAQHWHLIEKDRISYISMQAVPATDLALEQSKFGHYPCLPLDFDYPKDTEGRYMYPLAQIDFKEIPQLAGYPQSGYLQFYISGFDNIYGIDFDNPQSQKNFRVLYFEESEVENYKADFSFLDEVMESDMLPIDRPHALSFTKKDEFVGMGDAQYEARHNIDLSKIAGEYPAISSQLEDELYECFPTNGHKIGGYAYFTQTDPREYGAKFKDYILLLQIDSGDNIMWGDVGVANFFIHPDDLAKKDFSKVMYNWDCS